MSAFKTGDKVFHHEYGWGTVESNDNPNNPFYLIIVNFVSGVISFTNEGRVYINDVLPSLSFTEYNFKDGGFSQERPEPDYTEYIGKWGYFYASQEQLVGQRVIRVLKNINVHSEYPYLDERGSVWQYFKPLTEEQTNILELK